MAEIASSATRHASQGKAIGAGSHGDKAWVERCRYIPVRLDASERQLLALLEAALNVSEYTDTVDTPSRRNRPGRMLQQLRDMCAIASGLYVACDLKKGEKLCDRPLHESEEFFQKVFEVGRRYKIMNPSKMRSSYGKLMYMMQDSQNRQVQGGLGMDLWCPIKMVGSFLASRGDEALTLLTDARAKIATDEVRAVDDTGAPKPREQIDDELAMKRDATAQLVEDYGGEGAPLSAEEVEIVLASIADANNYLEANVTPVVRILDALHDNFDPSGPEKPYSLAIGGGIFSRGGLGGGWGAKAKLSHDHRTQFTFVHQTFTLWREVMTHMYKLWCLADEDLLSTSGSGYQLFNTGQGLNRVQRCPRVANEMGKILARVQREVGGGWVGLSVVHLGDRDVPNALFFIDKYTQLPRILKPIADMVDELENPDGVFSANEAVAHYVKKQFGDEESLKKTLLCDFFRHAFDGDGDDGGSCIDGRLTSTWNWCSRVEKKPYYHCWMLNGFVGFDGDWKDSS